MQKEVVVLKVKKLIPEATIPFYSREGDVGLDLVATSCEIDGDVLVCGTGLAIEIPEGYYADLRARSSIAKYDAILANGVGTIDSNYRGELIFKFRPTQDFHGNLEDNDVSIRDADLVQHPQLFNVGDKIGQLVVLPYPRVIIEEVDELSDSNRGAQGFGSSGN